MSRFVDFRSWPGWVLRNPLAFLATLLVGAASGFAYSYLPLHASKLWRIDYLEERVAGLNVQLRHLEVKLSQAKAEARARPSDDELSNLRTEVDSLKKDVARYKKEASRAESELAELERSRDEWKSQHARALAEIDALKARQAPPPVAAIEADPWDAPPDAATGDPDGPLLGSGEGLRLP